MQLEALQTLALSVAQARSPDRVLREMVSGLGLTEGVALARVWLIEQEPEGERHLRLRASVGYSLAEPGMRWTRTDGGHEKIPLSYGKVGKIAASGQPLLLHQGTEDWLLQPKWAEREQIQSFAGQPLIFNGETLGVVAIFRRRPTSQQELGWLRVFADHAATAIANARAFEEIANLKESLEQERDYLRQEVRRNLHHGDLVAESDAMRRVMAELGALAPTDTTVLICGESGVGKELVATAIHERSGRAQGPLVKVNCASVPHDLFESEFFGHVRGAFSGATRDREGRFQLANGGTLFLDEVGEIPLSLQGKLLRALQERAFERVGEDRTRKVDIRLIAATNRDLQEEVRQGRFRKDLYYRLSVVPVEIPPLRRRPEDIVPLTQRFLTAFARQMNCAPPKLTDADAQALQAYDFPGNIRELRNIVERAVVMHQATGRAVAEHLPSVGEAGATAGARGGARGGSAQWDREQLGGAAGCEGALGGEQPGGTAGGDAAFGGAAVTPAEDAVMPAQQLRDLERRNIRNALRRCEGKIAGRNGAAALLGMKPSTLHYQIKSLGIDRETLTSPGSHRAGSETKRESQQFET